MRGKVAKRLRRIAMGPDGLNKAFYKALKAGKPLHEEPRKPERTRRRKPMPVAKTASVKPAHLVRANLRALREMGHEMPGHMWRDVRQNWLNAPRHFLVWSMLNRIRQGSIVAKFN